MRQGYNSQELKQLFSTAPSKLTKCALAIAILAIDRDAINKNVKGTLIEILTYDQQIMDEYQWSPPYDVVMSDMVKNELFKLSKETVVTVLERVLECWHRTDIPALQNLANIIIQDFFACLEFTSTNTTFLYSPYHGITVPPHPIWLIEPLKREQLSKVQYRALVALLQCTPFWSMQTNLLEQFGLPATRENLNDFLHPNRVEYR